MHLEVSSEQLRVFEQMVSCKSNFYFAEVNSTLQG